MKKKQPEQSQLNDGVNCGQDDSFPIEQPENSSAGEDQELLPMLQAGLNQLDEIFPVEEPSLHWISDQLEEHHAVIRRTFIRDLSLFFTLAIVVLTVMVFALLQVPVVFYMLQVAVLLIAPVYTVLYHRRGGKRVGGP